MEKTAYIFDFDDTLAHSDAEIKLFPFRDGRPCTLDEILMQHGHRMTEKPQKVEFFDSLIEYSVRSPFYNEIAWRLRECGVPMTTDSTTLPITDCVVADFTDFTGSKSARPIQRYIDMAKESPVDDLFVCTGRHPKRIHPTSNEEIDAAKHIGEFMASHDVFVHPDNIMCVGDMDISTPEAKAATIIKKVIPQGYKRIVFVDDCEKNINAVYESCYPFCDVTTINSMNGTETSSPSRIMQKAKEKRLSAAPLSRLRSMAGVN